MKKEVIILLLVLTLSSCVVVENKDSEKADASQEEIEKMVQEETDRITKEIIEAETNKITQDITESEIEKIRQEVIARETERITKEIMQQFDEQNVQFPEFCTGWDDCDDYCHSFSAECEEYCTDKPSVEYCKVAFSWLIEGENRPHYLNREGFTIWGTPEIDCSDEFELFGTSPVAPDDFEFLHPLGFMGGSHVSPTDHHYFTPRLGETGIRVYAPGSGTLVKIERMGNREISHLLEDYNLVIQHSCDVFTNYIHVNFLSEKIKNAIGELATGQVAYPNLLISEGEVLATLDIQEGWPRVVLDFSVSDVRNEQYVVNPDSFYYTTMSPWHRWIQDDTFSYFASDVASALKAKVLRTTEPTSGKIHYDIDGKLVGNWFRENEDTRLQKVGDSKLAERNNLAFAYNYFDPSVLMVGIGYEEDSAFYGLIGPDPATVGVGELVQYKLGDIDFFIGEERWDRATYTDNLHAKVIGDEGTLLVELVDDRKLRMELNVDSFESPVWYVR